MKIALVLLLIYVVTVLANSKDHHRVKDHSTKHELHTARNGHQNSVGNHQQRLGTHTKQANHRHQHGLHHSENKDRKSQHNSRNSKHDHTNQRHMGLHQSRHQAGIHQTRDEDPSTTQTPDSSLSNSIRKYTCIIQVAQNVTTPVQEDFETECDERKLCLEIDGSVFFEADVVSGATLNCTFPGDDEQSSEEGDNYLEEFLCANKLEEKIIEKFKPEVENDSSKKHKIVLKENDEVIMDITLDVDSPTCTSDKSDGEGDS